MPSPHECHLTAEVANRVGLADRHYPTGEPEGSPTRSAADVCGCGSARRCEEQLVGFSVTTLTNGNYVVTSPSWSDGAHLGATTWCDGAEGCIGVVTAANSLIDTGSNVFALTNGNYVVQSMNWGTDIGSAVGAVTWADGGVATVGVVSAANSLIGSSTLDGLSGFVIALENGNYVAVNPNWSNGSAHVGAVTWRDGLSPATGIISASNSLVGSTSYDSVGYVVALRNGNYVVASPFWDNGDIVNAGAVTWGDGMQGVAGTISPQNSLVGTSPYDALGNGGGIGITPLTDGNYVIASPGWNSGGVEDVGAATWADGTAPIAGTITASNSLIGSVDHDSVGSGGVVALPNGDYAVASDQWGLGNLFGVGAVTWVQGGGTYSGIVTVANSLFGSTGNDWVGGQPFLDSGVTAVDNGDLIIVTPLWDNASVENAGAATLTRKNLFTPGPIDARNSVVGTLAEEGSSMVTAYDANAKRLVVGRRRNNMISILNPDAIFADGFDANGH